MAGRKCRLLFERAPLPLNSSAAFFIRLDADAVDAFHAIFGTVILINPRFICQRKGFI